MALAPQVLPYPIQYQGPAHHAQRPHVCLFTDAVRIADELWGHVWQCTPAGRRHIWNGAGQAGTRGASQQHIAQPKTTLHQGSI